MRDLQDSIWLELKTAIEEYTKALEENVDIALINSLADKIKELETRLGKIGCVIAGVFHVYTSAPPCIMAMHLAEAPEYDL